MAAKRLFAEEASKFPSLQKDKGTFTGICHEMRNGTLMAWRMQPYRRR
jgi:hypothetical protein